MTLPIPELSLVLLIGASGSGKSTFSRRHFKPTEVISSDHCRALVSDDENNLDATKDAFDLVRYIAAKRLARGLLTVIDATNVQPEARKPFVELAREYHVVPVAIVLDVDEEICLDRNRRRPDRAFGSHVVRNQRKQLARSIRRLDREGFRYVHRFSTPGEIDSVVIERQPPWTDRRGDHGPFDIIGDIHGCCDELEQLLGKLGYQPEPIDDADALYQRLYRHPAGRRAVFLGDIVDRGPRILDAFQLVRNMVNAGTALCVPGNHDVKLMRKLRGRAVQVNHGLEATLAELDALPESCRKKMESEMVEFIDALVSHFVLDDGRLVVAHAGMKETMQGRASARVRDFALYGETTGETDEFGLPVRYDWAAEYRGKAMVVYGHTPVPKPEWLNQTINIDTGCVFGGRMTALRYPESELVSIDAVRTYVEPIRPFAHDASDLTAQQEHDALLDIDDLLGKRILTTRLVPSVTIREENGAAALEVMSRYAIDPRWLIYLPPTMSPPGTSREPGLLEHPSEVFAYYRSQGVENVICEEKHMGSRAVVVLCRDEAAARERFGANDGATGVCYTRTGRPFFEDRGVEEEMIARLRHALTASGFWEEFATGWVVLDCELMPWSAKAQVLLRDQYAAVGAASRVALNEAIEAIDRASDRGVEVSALRDRFVDRRIMAARYVDAYGRYCWPVRSIDDLKLAPFHILGTEGAVHVDRSHLWHLDTIDSALAAERDRLLHPTRRLVIDLSDDQQSARGIRWWEEITNEGGEGMVVKPLDFLVATKGGPIQPAMKCRGREYLRIIYGPEYTMPQHLEELRGRNVSLKRSLAVRELALGIEALERFVRREPLRKIHECVFGVLALESEPVDPRL